MAKNSLSDWDLIAANNTDIGGIGVVGGSAVSNFDNAFREIMAQLKAGALDKTGDTATGVIDGIGFTVSGAAVFFVGVGIAQSEVVNLVADLAAKAANARNINAGTALTGGGDLSADRTINADLALKTEAEAGLINTKLMTPLRVAEAIATIPTSIAPNAILEGRVASGTGGGTLTAGTWVTRMLNTEIYDPDNLASISSNEFTPTVDGWIEWECRAYDVNRHTTRLYDVTNTAEVQRGMTSYAVEGDLAVGGGAVLAGVTYRIEHKVQTTSVSGGGLAGSFGTEVYVRVKFWRKS